MACDTQVFNANQTLTERKLQVKETVDLLAKALVRGDVKATVGPQGAIAFAGWQDRKGITDACAYRRIMATGSALAKAKLAQAEQLAGRAVDKKLVGHGHHSHDGGKTWHGGHK
jgi:hypothetical protein